MAAATGRIDNPRAWGRLLVGLAAVYAMFQVVASALGSERGEAGILIGVLVVLGLVCAERWLFAVPLRIAPRQLGLTTPSARSIIVAAIVGGALLAVIPAFALATATPLAMAPGWALMLPGLFAQAGIAEEALFRGYLFGHVYRGRGFWRAAMLSIAPFAAAHLYLFVVLPWPVALASVLLAVLISPPLAHLYAVGGNTIWAPALLHLVVQGALKIVTLPTEAATTLPVLWIAACAVLPYCVFFVRRPGG